MSGAGKHRVVIVGGGVTGLSAGWWLARAGVSVTVLDRFIVGWEASGRNGGGCSHYQSPLFDEEQRLWPQMEGLLGYPVEWQAERIVIATDDKQHRQGLFIADKLDRMGYRCDRLDEAQVRAAVPLAGANHGGLHYRFGGHANPQRTSQAYAWACQDLGGTIHQHSPVTGFVTAGGRVTAVTATTGTYECDALVIAAGPQTAGLAAQLGVLVPLAAARAEMIVTEPAAMMPLTGVDGNQLYGRQTLRGNLAYGGGPHEWLTDETSPPPQPRPATPLARNLAKRLADLLPGAAHLNVIRSWAGIIENTPDGRPIIDHLPGQENVVIASMSSVGFGLSPASGHAIRDLVLDGACSFADIGKFSLARFADLAPDWRAQRGWVPA